MILNIVFKLLVALLGFSVSYVIHRLYHNHQAHQFFKKKAPYLFVRPIPSILVGNADSVFSKRNWREAHEIHEKYGPIVCFYFSDIPVVSTLDLDLIKKVAIDAAANSNTNRALPQIAIDELEVDNILYSKDEQWYKIRKSIAPAFS